MYGKQTRPMPKNDDMLAGRFLINKSTGIRSKQFDPKTERMVKLDHRTWKVVKK